jgi:orotidine-5'-phosphate decarboxylase
MKDKIIVALDTQDREYLNFLIKELSGTAKIVKVGMELYYTFGNDIIKELKDHDFKIFLDLKIHDIPTTIYSACKTLAKNGVDIINVHASGGVNMMKAGLEGLREGNDSSMLIAVTQLTSTTKKIMNEELLVSGEVQDIVLDYALKTYNAGLDGIVCSPLEVELIKTKINSNFKCITPGIRPINIKSHDQQRIMTPAAAIKAGSDYLVIGRAITQVKSPKVAFNQINKDLTNEFCC